jgi:hypothetical protein
MVGDERSRQTIKVCGASTDTRVRVAAMARWYHLGAVVCCAIMGAFAAQEMLAAPRPVSWLKEQSGAP